MTDQKQREGNTAYIKRKKQMPYLFLCFVTTLLILFSLSESKQELDKSGKELRNGKNKKFQEGSQKTVSKLNIKQQ